MEKLLLQNPIKSIFMAGCISLFFISCNSLDKDSIAISETKRLNLTTEEIERLPLLNSNHDISLEDAQKQVEEIAGMLDKNMAGKTTSKSSVSRYIKGVRIIKSNCKIISSNFTKTKSIDSSDSINKNTKLYLFNFGEEKGYVLISGDNRVPGVISYSAEGSVGDTIINPGMALFLSGVENYMSTAINKKEALKDSIYESLKAKIASMSDSSTVTTKTIRPVDNINYDDDYYNISYSYGTPQTYKLIDPYISTLWSQVGYYNNSIPVWCDKNNDQAYAGCVTIASAQIINYYYPVTNSQIPDFIYDVSKAVKSSYGCDGTSSNIGNANDALTNRYHLSTGGVVDYDYSTLIKSLDAGCPLLTTGAATMIRHKFLGITFYNTYEDGHAWVVDGYKTTKQDVTETITYYNKKIQKPVTESYTSSNYQTLLHCNWGWGIGYNGYYISGAFDSTNPVTRSNNQYDYVYDLQMIPFIKK